MSRNGLVSKTEAYVRDVMSKQPPAMAVAHDFKHVDRVRNWALLFAGGEQYPDAVVVEVTALLHDIGLGHISGPEAHRAHVVLPPHGPLGAEMAEQFLKANSWTRSLLPIAFSESLKKSEVSKLKKFDLISNSKFWISNFILSPINFLFFLIQYIYMYPKITSERVSLGYAFFHPRSDSIGSR